MDDDRIAKLQQRGIISDRAAQRINMMPGLLTPAGPSPGAGVPGRGAPIKKYKDALVLNKITPKEFEGFMDAFGADKSFTAKMIGDAHSERQQLLQAVREELSGMHEQGLIRGPAPSDEE